MRTSRGAVIAGEAWLLFLAVSTGVYGVNVDRHHDELTSASRAAP